MPVWEDFFSEDDKRMVANRKTRPPKPHAEFGERPAILVIDMNKGAVGPDRPVHEIVDEMPGAMGANAWAAIRHMQELLPRARAAGIPIVYSKHLFKETTGLRMASPESPYSALNPLSEIQEEIALQPGDLLVEKQQASVFSQTGLVNMLMNKGVDNLIVTGNSTSGCVHATTVDAGAYQLKVSVLEECVFDRFDLSHAAALFNLGSKYADIVSIEETYDYLATIKDGQREAAQLVGAPA
jgi:nicotinamidase-related amidase